MSYVSLISQRNELPLRSLPNFNHANPLRQPEAMPQRIGGIDDQFEQAGHVSRTGYFRDASLVRPDHCGLDDTRPELGADDAFMDKSFVQAELALGEQRGHTGGGARPAG